MTKKPQNDEELLAQFDRSRAKDVLSDETSNADVAEILRAAGGDPEAIGKRGALLVEELMEKRRLAWQEQARRKIERAKPILGKRADYLARSRDEMLGLYEKARANPDLSRPISQLFHKRRAEELSTDELRELLQEADALALLDAATEDADEKK